MVEPGIVTRKDRPWQAGFSSQILRGAQTICLLPPKGKKKLDIVNNIINLNKQNKFPWPSWQRKKMSQFRRLVDVKPIQESLLKGCNCRRQAYCSKANKVSCVPPTIFITTPTDYLPHIQTFTAFYYAFIYFYIQWAWEIRNRVNGSYNLGVYMAKLELLMLWATSQVSNIKPAAALSYSWMLWLKLDTAIKSTSLQQPPSSTPQATFQLFVWYFFFATINL